MATLAFLTGALAGALGSSFFAAAGLASAASAPAGATSFFRVTRLVLGASVPSGLSFGAGFSGFGSAAFAAARAASSVTTRE